MTSTQIHHWLFPWFSGSGSSRNRRRLRTTPRRGPVNRFVPTLRQAESLELANGLGGLAGALSGLALTGLPAERPAPAVGSATFRFSAGDDVHAAPSQLALVSTVPTGPAGPTNPAPSAVPVSARPAQAAENPFAVLPSVLDPNALFQGPFASGAPSALPFQRQPNPIQADRSASDAGGIAGGSLIRAGSQEQPTPASVAAAEPTSPGVPPISRGHLLPSPAGLRLPGQNNPRNSAPPSPSAITLVPVATGLNQPIGIDYQQPSNSLVVSLHYPTGQDSNFIRIGADGSAGPYSTASGLTDELNLAAVRPGPAGGFVAGDLFTGNGQSGQIIRITDGGDTVINPWVSLPDDGLLRGGLTFDRTGLFGGDLIAATTNGTVWEIDSAGRFRQLANVGAFLEGVTVVPDDPARYGPLAGKIVSPWENESGGGGLYTIDPAGNTSFYPVDLSWLEDIHLITPNENFYGVDFAAGQDGAGQVLGVSAAELAPLAGDLVLAQEAPSTPSGLYDVTWDGSALQVTPLTLSGQSASVTGWEQVTFAPAGVAPLTTPTTTAVTSAPLPSVYGQPVTLTATVTPSAPEGTPTGTVTFYDGGTVLGTGTLNGVGGNDQATFTTAELTGGDYSITATYNGDANFLGSSGATTQTVNPALTTTTVASSANPSSPGQAVTFTATVSAVAPGAGTPTGTVTFRDGGTVLGTATLNGVSGNDQATFTTSALNAADHYVTATYDGTPNFRASTGYLLQSVTALPVVSVTATTPLASEQGPTPGAFTVTRTGATGAPLTVTYTVGGTARAGTDYAALSGSVVIPAGQSSAAIPVTPLNDGPNEPNESVVVTLQANPSYTVGSQNNDTVTLQTTLLFTAVVRTTDPRTGNALLQNGDVQYQVPLNLTQSPGAGTCSCSCATASALPMSASLDYNSDTVHVQPIVQAMIPTDPSQPLPTSIDARLTWDGVTQPTQTFPVSGQNPGDTLVLGVQVAQPVTQTGRHDWSLTVTLHFAGSGDLMGTVADSSFVVAQDGSPFGAGWSLSLLDRLVPIPADGDQPAGALWVDGNGQGARFFAQSSPTTFTSPENDFGTLVRNGDGSYTYTEPHGDRWQFDANGQLLARTSADNASRYDFQYDASGRLTGLTAPDNAQDAFHYDVMGRLESLDVAGGRTYTFDYSQADLVQVTDPADGVYRFSYDGNDRLAAADHGGETQSYTYDHGQAASVSQGSEGTTHLTPADAQGVDSLTTGEPQAIDTDGRGYTTYTTLDDLGRTVRQEDALGGVTTSQYDVHGDLVATTDPLERTTRYVYDTQGDLLQTIYPDGTTETNEYNDPHHNVTRSTDARGFSTDYTYDSDGHLLTQTDPLGNTTRYTWADGLEQTRTDPRGYTTQYVYDPDRRLIATIDPLGGVTATTYDPDGYVASTTMPNRNTTTYVNDALGRVLETTDALGNVREATYDEAGNVLTETDALRRVTQHVYDDRGLEIQLTEAAGTPVARTTTRAYDADGNLVEETDPRGLITQYSYDALDRRTETTDAAGNMTSTTYDAAGEVIAETDARGNTTRHVYDDRDRAIETIDALGDVSMTQYDAAGNVVAQTDPLGRTTAEQYDADNRQTEVVDPQGNPTTTAYDRDGNVVATTDALGRTTTEQYDADNRLVERTDPLGHVTVTSYDADGNVIAVTDPRGNTTTTEYDADDRSIATTDPLGNVTQTAYDPVGNVSAVTDAAGNTTQYEYNDFNEVISLTDPLGNVTQTNYDDDGNVMTTTDPAGNSTQYQYDELNRVIEVTDPLGNVTTTTYDPDGNVIATTDPLKETTQSVYDALNRKVESIDALGNVTRTVYDADGNVIATIDPNGNQTTSTFDADNREVSRTDPLGHTTRTTYDAAGNVLSTTDRDGRRSDMVYDADNRLITETWVAADGTTITDVKNYTYDEDGNVISAANNAGAYAMTYDADNRLQTQTDPSTLVLTYQYDAVGNAVSVQDSLGGRTVSMYDADGHLVSRQFSGAGQPEVRMDLTYTPDGLVESETRYADLAGTNVVGYTFYTYDAANQVVDIHHVNNVYFGRDHLKYSYDATGRLTEELDNYQFTDYTYDAAGQLTSDGAKSYAYDPNGNRTNSGYETGPANEQWSANGALYTYDNEGNVIQKTNTATGESWAYTYDNANFLTSAQLRAADGTLLQTVNYTYDALGNRLEEDVTTGTTTVTTRFAYDRSNVWADLDGHNQLQARRLYLDGLDQVFARIGADGTVAWYLTDRLGSVRDLLDEGGNVQDHLDYDGFGNVVSESNASFGDRYQFTGREFDSTTGLQYNRVRYYDAQTGRWTSQDPLGFAAGDSNLYRYVFNDPVDSEDPLGLAKYQAQFDVSTFGPSTAPPQISKKTARAVASIFDRNLPRRAQDLLRDAADKLVDVINEALQFAFKNSSVHFATKWCGNGALIIEAGMLPPPIESVISKPVTIFNAGINLLGSTTVKVNDPQLATAVPRLQKPQQGQLIQRVTIEYTQTIEIKVTNAVSGNVMVQVLSSGGGVGAGGMVDLSNFSVALTVGSDGKANLDLPNGTTVKLNPKPA